MAGLGDLFGNDPDKHEIYLKMCVDASEMSKCPRRGVFSILLNVEGRVKGSGYNGTVSGAANLCGGNVCLREEAKIKSGTKLDVGCLHSEMNLIINCSREDLLKGVVYVSAEPCLFCAKMLAQSGISKLYYILGRYAAGGASFLVDHGVEVFEMEVK